MGSPLHRIPIPTFIIVFIYIFILSLFFPSTLTFFSLIFISILICLYFTSACLFLNLNLARSLNLNLTRLLNLPCSYLLVLPFLSSIAFMATTAIPSHIIPHRIAGMPVIRCSCTASVTGCAGFHPPMS